MSQPADRERLRRLTSVNRADLFRSFKVVDRRWLRPLLHLLFTPPARNFSRAVLEFDRQVGEVGLAAGSAWLANRMAGPLHVVNREALPGSGPALIICNHPGLTDTVSLFATLKRADVRVIAARRPFLDELLAVRPYLLEVDEDDDAQGSAVLRAGLRHLQSGGLLITFPAGRIEPDPCAAPGAVDSLEGWSESIALFVRQVPGLVVLPVLICGVINPAALRHPLARCYRSKTDQEWAGATLQLLLPWFRRVRATVAYSDPLSSQLLAQGGRAEIMAQARAAMRALIARYGEYQVEG